MRQSSAILATPIQLAGGPATKELPGEAADVDLVANYEHHVLEIYQGGKKVAERPFSGVIEMRPATKGEICDVCGEGFDDSRGLGGHRWYKHQIPSPTRESRDVPSSRRVTK